MIAVREPEPILSGALRIDAPTSAADAFIRGNELFDKEDYSKALVAYDRALKLDPNSSSALVNRGTVLGQLGRNEEALADYDRAIELHPSFQAAHYNRGLAL